MVTLQVFWRSKPKREPPAAPKPRAWLALILEVLCTFILPFILAVACTATQGKKKYWQLPGKPATGGVGG